MRPPRLAATHYLGPNRYFLTICTFNRFPHFRSQPLVEDVRGEFLRSSRLHGFAEIAYCYMPDHVHILTEATEPAAALTGMVCEWKQHSAHAARRWIRGRLWQAGYYDRILREGDDPASVVRYIVENPVRAGLAKAAADYPFTGSGTYSMAALLEAAMWTPGAP